MTEKLVVCVMGQNCEKFIGMCLESVKQADAIVYCDGGSTDNTWDKVNENAIKNNIAIRVIENEYNQEDKCMNGKQRNFYLNFLKENYPNDWALCLDADEVVEDLGRIKEFIQIAQKGLYSVKMRHFHEDLGHEDAMQETHYVLNRLFYVDSAEKYPEVEHPVLLPKKEASCEQTDITTIWHLAHIDHVFSIKKRYEKNLKHSNMHTKDFLDKWYFNHIFGRYPNKAVNPLEIPKVILDNFGIDKDMFYFAERGIEIRHPIMVKQWNDYFKPSSVLELGCGRGVYLYFWKWFVDYADGIELSDWAINHAFVEGIKKGDIAEIDYGKDGDLVTAFDVLEHLDDEQLDKTLGNMVKYGKQFLISVPVVGDPNLTNDSTHKQFRTMQEWIELIESYGIKIEQTPKDWLFWSQIIIGRKK